MKKSHLDRRESLIRTTTVARLYCLRLVFLSEGGQGGGESGTLCGEVGSNGIVQVLALFVGESGGHNF